MIYGPSGCGKSSLVKAGLLPRLKATIRVVYLEAIPAETETQLLRSLYRACSGLPEQLDLVGAIAALRRGRLLADGEKILLVLDQFE